MRRASSRVSILQSGKLSLWFRLPLTGQLLRLSYLCRGHQGLAGPDRTSRNRFPLQGCHVEPHVRLHIVNTVASPQEPTSILGPRNCC